LAFLDFVGDLVGREVTGCAYEDLGDGPLGDRGASVSPRIAETISSTSL